MVELVVLVGAVICLVTLVLLVLAKNPEDALDPYRNHGVGLQHDDNDDRG